MTQKQLESLDLNLLLSLHWILTERNITAAAGKIGVSQPAASRALARLREVFNDPLLVRTGNDMAPTRLGERLAPVVALAVERCRDVLKITDKFDPSTQSGQFRVACVDYVGVMVAAAWMRAISPVAPELELDIINPSLEISRDLVSGKIDLVILPDIPLLNLPPTIDIDQFVRRKILSQRYLCGVRKGHPIKQSKMTLKQFLSFDHVLVTPAGAKIGIVDQMLRDKGKTRKIAYRTSSFLLALPIVRKTDCIITAPESLLQLDKSNFQISTPPLPVPGFSMFGGWHPNWTRDERHKWVRDRLFEALSPKAA